MTLPQNNTFGKRCVAVAIAFHAAFALVVWLFC